MRHTRIDLTMNVYTDPRLLDVPARRARCPGGASRPAETEHPARNSHKRERRGRMTTPLASLHQKLATLVNPGQLLTKHALLGQKQRPVNLTS